MSDMHPPSRSEPLIDELVEIVERHDRRAPAERKRDAEQFASDMTVRGLSFESREEMLYHAYESLSPAKRMQGAYISSMRDRALFFVKDKPFYQDLCRIPVALLPTGLLNGQACRNKNGQSFILIDSGMQRELTEIMHAYYSFKTWGWNDDAHCRDHSQLDFAKTLIMLTMAVCSNDSRSKNACPARIDACPSMKRFSERRENLLMYGNRFRDFVMLHEYGHVALGHLAKAGTSALSIGPTRITEQVARHEDEFEADSFAIRALMGASGRLSDGLLDAPPSGKPIDYAVMAFAEPVAVVMRFWDLLEALLRQRGSRFSGTHPPPISRWRKLHTFLKSLGIEKDFLSDVDYMFDTILEWFNLPPATTRLQ